MYDKILWIMIYRDLKENSIEKLKEHIELLQQRKRTFGAHFELPLKIYFNKRKFTSKQYLDLVTKFDENRKIDFIFYFAPFVFSDNQEIFYDSSKGFIFKNKQNLKSLEDMIEYNAKFIELIKQDPIVRVDKLTKLLNKDTKSYIYYNLGLSCAQINDFHHAYQYFKKAYKLNPGNKVFAAMTLICAKRVRIRVRDKAYIEENILSKDGLYSYFGQSLYKMIIDPKSKIKIKKDVQKYEKTIFYKAMRFLINMEEKGIVKDDPLLVDHYKDPLVYLIKLVAKDKNSSNYQYISRMQDEVPLKLNNNFLEGPLIVTQYYIDILKALGLFSKADLDIPNSKSPSYLRTKAFRDLHAGNPESTISILEYLQDKYKLEDKYTLYLMVASLLEAKRENDASVTISLIKALLNDDGADFLTGVQLLQELKFTSALQYFNYPYKDSLIDFKLVGLDKFLESL
jgi:phosphotransferase system IIB component